MKVTREVVVEVMTSLKGITDGICQCVDEESRMVTVCWLERLSK